MAANRASRLIARKWSDMQAGNRDACRLQNIADEVIGVKVTGMLLLTIARSTVSI